MRAIGIALLFHTIFLCNVGFQNAFKIPGLESPVSPEDSEVGMPSIRRTTRISRYHRPDNPLSVALIRPRRNEFDQFGPTKDDIKIENFWRNYGKILESNSNDKLGLDEIEETLAENRLQDEINSEIKEALIKQQQEELQVLQQVLEAKEIEDGELPTKSEDATSVDSEPEPQLEARFSARSEQNNTQNAYTQTPNVVVLPYPYQRRPSFYDAGAAGPIRTQPMPWLPPNFVYYDGQNAFPLPMPRPSPAPPMSIPQSYPPLGYYYPVPMIHNSASSRPVTSIHAPYTIPSPASDMPTIPASIGNLESSGIHPDNLTPNGKPVSPISSGVPQSSYPVVPSPPMTSYHT